MLRTMLISCGLTLTALAPCAITQSRADDSMSGMQMNGMQMAMPVPGAQVAVTWMQYAVPDVQLMRASGKRVALTQELGDGKPVVMNFFYTTCETTCPMSSATFSMFEHRLGGERANVHLMSISIDPEQDTPTRLRSYAKQFHADPEWQFYTGTLAASVAVQQAFGTYRGDKMSHTPVTLMRAAPGKPWLRIDGFATPDQLLTRYRQLLASS